MKKIRTRFLLACGWLLLSCVVHAQTQGQLELRLSREQRLVDVLDSIERNSGVRFFYRPEWIVSVRISPNGTTMTLERMLDRTLDGTDLTFIYLHDYAIVFLKDIRRDIERESVLQSAQMERRSVNSFVVGDSTKDKGLSRVTIRGTVRTTAGDPIPGVTVSFPGNTGGTITNSNGVFEWKTTRGSLIAVLRFIGYEETVIDMDVRSSGSVEVTLPEASRMLDEVVVSDQQAQSRRIGQTTIELTALRRSPTFLGERDVIKQIQMQPGVTSVGEVSGGYNVRGSTADQNLVLYDGVPVFNASHALGFFGAFNSESLGNVTLYKGGVPAEFGGRNSSVLDVRSRTPDMQKPMVNGGIGMVSSNLVVQTPIVRGKAAALASFRTSYSDWMLKLLKSNYKDLASSSLAFYDGALKVAGALSEKTKLTLSGYVSQDHFRIASDTMYSWRNELLSARFDRQISRKLFGTITLLQGRYRYDVREEDDPETKHLRFDIRYPGLNLDFNIDGGHKLAFGLQNFYYEFQPGTYTDGVSRDVVPREYALESSVYFSDAFNIAEKLFIETGLRYSRYWALGPGQHYVYDESKPRDPIYVVDSVRTGKRDVQQMYEGFEPRLSLRYSFDNRTSIKLGFNRMYQYVQMISNTASVNPIDIWQPSNTYFKPQWADQLSLGFVRLSSDNRWEWSIESFYKDIRNIIDYKDGANLVMNKQLETAVLTGRGSAYGVELMINRHHDRTTGGVNYTFSRSFRRIQDEFYSVNRGERYPNNFDQPHVVNLNARYEISRRVYLTGNFVYRSGRPISPVVSEYSVDGIVIVQFVDRNSVRLPDYHRLDIALVVEGTRRKTKKIKDNWTFSFYNVYSRRNAYSAFFRRDESNRLKAYKLSAVGTVIPTINYSFNF